jgi:hypothetical protein
MCKFAYQKITWHIYLRYNYGKLFGEQFKIKTILPI